uniref:Putative salivary protein of 15kda inhibits cd4+ t cell activation n=1 Tax=Ixodes ricinus TaxID=34613 RepID=A0A090X873_IXORI
MQLTQFMVVMGFAHLSWVQSASSSDFNEEMKCLAQHLKEKLMKQMETRCSLADPRITLQIFEGCRFTYVEVKGTQINRYEPRS